MDQMGGECWVGQLPYVHYPNMADTVTRLHNAQPPESILCTFPCACLLHRVQAMRRKATQPPGARDRALARQLAWLLSRFLAAAQGAGSSSRSSSSSEVGDLSSLAAGGRPGRQASKDGAAAAPVATAVTLRLAPRPQLFFRR